MYGTSTIITKEFIFKHISQEQIFQHYLNHSTIELRKKNYVNTLRNDSNPDCSYFEGNTGILYFRDFALGKSYSCFEIVQIKYGLNYQESLIQIATDFKLINNDKNINSNNIITFCDNSFNNNSINNIKSNTKLLTQIKVKKVEWNDKNSQYWKDYGFKKSTLDKFKVSPISHYWVNDYCFQAKQSYSYYHGFDQVHRRTILNLGVDKKYKWFKNTDDTTIQGYDLLPSNGDLLILTKAYKDILVYDEENISAVASNAEGIAIKPEKIVEFKQRFKRVVLQLDANNQESLNNSIRLSNLYDVPAIYLPEKLNYECKDISGVRKSEGIQNTSNLIKTLFNL